MPEKPPALMVERGDDPTTLIVAFCGMHHRMGVPPFEFFQVSKLLGYSRILIRDLTQTWYHRGFDENSPDMPAAAALLRRHIAELAPRKVVMIGNSAGSYAALVFGHLLGADVVHAFGPQTFLGPRRLLGVKNARSFFRLIRLYGTPTATWKYFDLKSLLATHNGKTEYFIHYCEHNEWDRYNSERLENLPGVRMRPYPCDRHSVTKYLVKQRLLMDVLKQEAPAVTPPPA